MLHIDDPCTIRLSAVCSDAAATHRRVARGAHIILRHGQHPMIERCAGLIIVSAWINERLHLAAYWPRLTR